MKTTDIKKTIRDFINNQFIKGDTTRKLEDGDSLLDKQIIDSTGLLELVMFIEETFEIRVEDEELVPENLDSIDRLNIYISNKTQRKDRV